MALFSRRGRTSEGKPLRSWPRWNRLAPRVQKADHRENA